MTVEEASPRSVLIDSDAATLARLVRTRAVTPVEIVEAFLRQIEAVEPLLNACCAIFGDEALKEAAKAERVLASGDPVGPLHGVPFAVKETVWISGKRCTSGSRALAEFVAPSDHVAVERLRAAGAIPLIQTTVSEFCVAPHGETTLFGITRNPWNLDRTPGGSSSGSAAGVAAHMAPFALGTDAGGSVRKPSALCGIAGIKPTHGLVPHAPGTQRWMSFDALGPMARSVGDLALILAAIRGADPRDAWCLPTTTSEVDRRGGVFGAAPRVAWSSDLGVVNVDASVRRIFARAVEKAATLGWQMEEAAPPAHEVNRLAWQNLYAETGRLPLGREHLVDDPETVRMFEEAKKLSAVEAHDARLERDQLVTQWESFFEHRDLLLTPTTACEAPAAGRVDATRTWDDYSDSFALCGAANLTGQPAVTIPAGLTEAGLPVGLQIVGRRGSDVMCLAAARELEQILEFPVRTSHQVPLTPVS